MADSLLAVRLGSIALDNPVLVASGTFGYAKEMSRLFDLSRLGGIVPKTITVEPRAGNRPPRTVETSSGLLNAIGLDNDGLDEFIAGKMSFLRTLSVPIFVSIAAKKIDETKIFAEKLNTVPGITALELNVSCPNVSGGVDFGTDPALCEKMVSALRKETSLPLAVKLTPNVTRIADIAKAAEAGGADMICATNTCFGLAVDWKRRKPRLANGCGGFSGPAIKPISLRCVHQIYKAVHLPIIGIGGIATAEDVLEFFVAGASAVQVGTANFFSPTATIDILDRLPELLQKEDIKNIQELTGTLDL